MNVYTVRRIRVPAFKWSTTLIFLTGSFEKLTAQIISSVKNTFNWSRNYSIGFIFFPLKYISFRWVTKREKIIIIVCPLISGKWLLFMQLCPRVLGWFLCWGKWMQCEKQVPFCLQVFYVHSEASSVACQSTNKSLTCMFYVLRQASIWLRKN